MPPRKGKASSNPAQTLIADAESLQQRGERRKGQEAAQCFEQAAAKYQSALSLGLPPSQAPDAHFGLAECLQLWAEAGLEAAARLPDDQLSAQVERAAQAQACRLYHQSVGEYHKVLDPDTSSIRSDAAVDCANVLAAWGEILAGPGKRPAAAAALYERARALYEGALREEEDAVTWGNLGDVCVQHAEALHAQGRTMDAAAAGQAAERAYHTAVGLSDSTAGDDLPGLLCNWGQGLVTLAGMAADPTTGAACLDQAIGRLRCAEEFDRGDPTPCCSIGDALVARAELAATSGSPGEAVAWLQQAMDQGYSRALAIRRGLAEGVVGCAEVHAELARLSEGAGDAEGAGRCWQACVQAYEAALRDPPQLGGYSERCDVRFNAACALARLGRAQEAHALLAGLVAGGGLTSSELLGDQDLARLSGQAWWGEVVQQAQQREAAVAAAGGPEAFVEDVV